MSSDVKIWFSALELGLLGAANVVAGIKRYEKGAREDANRLKWQQRSVECMGGKHGLRTEYRPPAGVLALIHTFLQANPGFFARSKPRKKHSSPSPGKTSNYDHAGKNVNQVVARYLAGDGQGCVVIDESMLNACHAACSSVYGDEFNALAIAEQLRYAVDLYNLMVKMSAQNGGLEQMKRLDITAVIDLLKVFTSLGWPRKFPPAPSLMF